MPSLDEKECGLSTVGAIEAVQSGNLQGLHDCINQLNVEDLWPQGSAPSLLEVAVEEKFSPGVKLLLSKAPPGLLSSHSVSRALLLAMRNDLIDIVRMFLESTLDGHLEIALLNTFFHAITKEQYDIAKRIIAMPEFDVNAEEFWDNERPLSVVVYRDLPHLAEGLIERGAVVDAPNVHGETALVVSCVQQFVDCCRLLLIHGADPNHHPSSCLSPLKASFSFSKDLMLNKEITELLLRAGLKINSETWIKTIIPRVGAADPDFLKSLKDLSKNPRSMKLLCFVKIRNHMMRIHHGMSIVQFIDELPLPLILKNYLKMSDW